jgi:two-component system, OmpR family, copper resistance phosphate regulon response regulator CusR
VRILIVEDEMKVARFLARGLREEQFQVEVSRDGEDGLHRALTEEFDLLILDVMLPGRDGFDVLRAIRAARRPVRVLMLTARDAVDDRVRGLEGGADDYLIKPFAFAECLARVRALLRRPFTEEQGERVLGDLTLNPRTRRVHRGGRSLSLTAREFSVLEYLLHHVGEVISRTRLAEAVWDANFDPVSNVIDVTIYHLREKLDRAGATPLIHTVRGAGYVLSEQPPAAT